MQQLRPDTDFRNDIDFRNCSRLPMGLNMARHQQQSQLLEFDRSTFAVHFLSLREGKICSNR